MCTAEWYTYLMKSTYCAGQAQGRLVVGLAVVITIGVTFYFFSPGFWSNFGQQSLVAGDSIAMEESQQRTDQNFSSATHYVYFSNQPRSLTESCEEVFPVARAAGVNKEADLLLALFRGPTDIEKSAGFSSFFSEATTEALKSISVRNAIAAVNLSDIRNIIPAVSSSCGSAQFMASVNATLQQFGTIEKVVYAIDGSPEKFYEWIQIGCSEENLNCDASLFQ